jgi:hypothetical protein
MNKCASKIDNVVKQNKIYRLNQELNSICSEEREKQLKEKIDLVELQKNEHTVNEEKRATHMETCRNAQYKKKWHILKKDQKDNRLIKFSKDNNIDKHVEEFLLNYNDKIGFKNKDLVFTNGDIVSIVVLDDNLEIKENFKKTLNAVEASLIPVQ